jgi:hypothetical protein
LTFLPLVRIEGITGGDPQSRADKS